jgi:hypothetical protein
MQISHLDATDWLLIIGLPIVRDSDCKLGVTPQLKIVDQIARVVPGGDFLIDNQLIDFPERFRPSGLVAHFKYRLIVVRHHDANVLPMVIEREYLGAGHLPVFKVPLEFTIFAVSKPLNVFLVSKQFLDRRPVLFQVTLNCLIRIPARGIPIAVLHESFLQVRNLGHEFHMPSVIWEKVFIVQKLVCKNMSLRVYIFRGRLPVNIHFFIIQYLYKHMVHPSLEIIQILPKNLVVNHCIVIYRVYNIFFHLSEAPLQLTLKGPTLAVNLVLVKSQNS